MLRALILVASFLIITNCLPAMLQAQNLLFGDMQINRLQWGMRSISFDINNQRPETATVSIDIKILYPGHFLSGLDPIQIDTNLVIPPHDSSRHRIDIEIPGAFGRLIIRSTAYFWGDRAKAGERGTDSTFQVFSTIFSPTGEAALFGDRKHCLGPVYSVIDYPIFNYEFPRLILHLMGQGKTPGEISNLFGLDHTYTVTVYQRLRALGMFPLASDSLAPGILAITEPEAFALKENAKEMTTLFAGWYESGGDAGLTKFCIESGIDDLTNHSSSFRLALFLTLFTAPWSSDTSAYAVPAFADLGADLKAQNRPRWIVQGGEFFLPRLCLAAFEQNGMLVFAGFRPDPTMPFEKAVIYDLRKAVEESAGALPTIDAAQLRQLIDKTAEDKKINDLQAEFKRMIKASFQNLSNGRPYQMTSLADYLLNLALGNYFTSQKPASGVDCIAVRYNK